MVLRTDWIRVIVILLLMNLGIYGIGCTLILNNGGQVETDKGEPNYGIKTDNDNVTDTD